MQRKARMDAPEALHRIIRRGIERRNIFRDDTGGNRLSITWRNGCLRP